ncbi:MAG TPA: DUF748 domain-containing protein [Usitatibacter sp.]|nr:DUF748 domain-containing protein [Usitatibacter sp.]
MNAPTSRPPSRSRLRIAAGVALAAVGLYAIVGFFLVPAVAKKLIVDNARQMLGRVVSLEALTFNPFTLDARATGVAMMEADGRTPFASLDHLDVNGSATSIYRLAPVVDALTIDGLKVRLVRDSETHYNVSDILAKLAAAPAKPAGEGARFSVSNIRLNRSRIDFDDRPKGAKHQVSDIEIAIPSLSNLPGHLAEYVKPTFAAKVNGAPIRFEGETLPFENSLRTHVAIALDALDVPRYVEYSPTALPMKIDAGKLDAKLSVRFTQAAGKDPSIDIAGTLALRDLRISAPQDGGAAQVARVDVEVASLDPLAGLAKLSSVKVSNAQAPRGPWHVASAEARDIRVDAPHKRVDVASFSSDGAAIDITRDGDGIVMPVRLAKSEAPPADSPPWTLALAKATLDGYRVALHDATVHPTLVERMEVVHLEAGDLSTAKGAKSPFAARLALANSGSVEAQGAFALSPFELEAKLDARHVDIVPGRRYVDVFKTVALKSGFASARGTLGVHGEGDAMRIAYSGTAAVTKLATVDTTLGEHLLDWDAVRMSGVALQWAANDPLNLAVADIAVDKAYSRIVVNPDGTLNLQQLKFATPAEPAAPAPAPGDVRPRNVRIDRIEFNDSRLDFADHYIRPNYAADVGGLSGTVTNLSSDPASRGVVDLKGSYDQASPVTIAGTVNPLSGDLFVDIAAKGKDIELPKLSAYSVRYAGYGITKGRLTLDVKYHVEHGKLEGHNRIFLDQLTFGDHVDGPDATKLPVLFAVNLLKNSKGEIDLELPISGSLDDPQFEVGALIAQVVSNLLKKALTHPFSLLTAALGGNAGAAPDAGGEDLALVEFPPGGDELSAPGQKKLDAVAKALLDRPAIRIEVAPGWDPGKDGEALKRAALLRRLKDAKRATLGKDAPQTKDIALDAADYARLLKAAYDREAPPKPVAKDAAATASKEPVAKEPSKDEMEAFLLARTPVGDEEFRALAARRGERVKDYLVAQGHLPAERVLLASSMNDKASRVDLALK